MKDMKSFTQYLDTATKWQASEIVHCIVYREWFQTQNSQQQPARTAVADGVLSTRIHPKISPSSPQNASHRPWDVPSEGTKQFFYEMTRCFCFESWGHTLGSWDVTRFTHSPCGPAGEHRKTKRPAWHADDWCCLTGACLCVCFDVGLTVSKC